MLSICETPHPPQGARQAMNNQGLSLVAGAPLPQWTAQRSLDLMNMQGIETALRLHGHGPCLRYLDAQAAPCSPPYAGSGH